MNLLRVSIALSLLVACKGEAAPAIRVEVVTPDGENPFDVGDFDEVTIRVQQGDSPVETATTEVTSTFDITFPVVSLSAEVRATVELQGPSDHLIGAAPTFRVVETGGFLKLIVAPPSTCTVIEGLELPTPARAAAASMQGTFAFIAGGEDADGPIASADFVDLLRMTADSFALAPSMTGPARMAPLGDGAFVVVGDEAAFVYDIRDAEDPITPISLHDGANSSSALARLADGTVVVVGGGDAEERASGATWVATDGLTEMAGLLAPRSGAALVVRNDGVLVIGGIAAGDIVVERIEPDEDPVALLVDADFGVRDGAIAIEDPESDAIFVFGGTDAAGLVRTDTWILAACTDECSLESGPEWDEARVGVAAIPTADGVLVAGGRVDDDAVSRVERVRIQDGTATFAMEGSLTHVRADASIVAPVSNFAIVLGGMDDDGIRTDAELCTPSDLDHEE